MQKPDLVIVGAGPAGTAAATQAAELGLKVCILDEQSSAGGQIYRDVDRVAPIRGDALGTDYTYGTRLTEKLHHANIVHISGATVWAIEKGFCVSYTQNGHGAQIIADHILLATGALERPMPIPGWTLPGVMTAGAGQILLKQSGVVAQNAVLVGSGPLLYLIACQMLRAGSAPKALIETQTNADTRAALRHLPRALQGWSYFVKGLQMLAAIRRAGVPRYQGTTSVSIVGTDHVEAVNFTHKGRTKSMSCDTVFMHHGVVPNTQAARSLGIAHHWHNAQQAFVPKLDDWGQSDLAGVFIAGDSAGIGGAKAAEVFGRLTALKIAEMTGRLTVSERDRKAGPIKRTLSKELAARPFLDTAYPPFDAALAPSDNTIICRCEEVTAGDIRHYTKLGCTGPNQAKAFGRAGMGPCQGRYCGLTVTTLIAKETGQAPDATGYYRIRPPLKPVTLGEIAAMDITTDESPQ